MIDRYSKLTLTVIAAALSVIAGQQLFQTAVAQDGAACGTTTPCMVVNAYWDDNSYRWKRCDTGDRACYVVAVKK